MSNPSWLPLLLLGALACGGGEPDARRPAAEWEPQESRLDTIHIEGQPEPTELTLYRTPEGFPLPFFTYVPQGIVVEEEELDDGSASVRFVAAFAGVRNPDAVVNLFVYPAGERPMDAEALAQAYAASRGGMGSRATGEDNVTDSPEPRRFDWSLAEYAYRDRTAAGEPILGVVAIGERAGRLYHVIVQYPAEYGDGFGPRARRIVDELRWLDGS